MLSLQFITRLPTRIKLLIAVIIDVGVLELALLVAFLLRWGEWPLPVMPPLWLFIVLPLVCLPFLFALKVYRAVIRYINIDSLLAVAKAMSLGTLVMLALGFMFSGNHELPRSVLPIFWGLSILSMTGIRLLTSQLLGAGGLSLGQNSRVAIYGAGEAGRQLASALQHDHAMRPMLFIDDDTQHQGRLIQGLPVYAPSRLDKLIQRHSLDTVLLAMPSVPRHRQHEILRSLESRGLKLMIMPGMGELASGSKRVDDLRVVEIEDLLGRTAVAANEKLLEHSIKNKSVMVTGAGGSIGTEICRQIVETGCNRLVLFENSEYALYSIEKELQGRTESKDIELVAVLGSVINRQRVAETIKKYEVDTIYHAAAYKHVPLIEANPLEGVMNNCFGTLITAESAIEAGVENFVLVSTDKAVRPPNVMGASKRMAEMVLQALAAEQSRTRLCMVRFGNVLASSGSVVPLFREQIRQGGPVSVTHPEMTRYFMTIPEASQLVIQAGAMGGRGEVFVLDMGEPVRIADLARRMVNLSGLSVRDEHNPDGDIEIRYVGTRPGEKLYEELLISDDDLQTEHPCIRCAQEEFMPWQALSQVLKQLQAAIEASDEAAVITILEKTVHGFAKGRS